MALSASFSESFLALSDKNHVGRPSRALFPQAQPIIASMRYEDTEIKAYSAESLAALLADYGQPAFRTRQILKWLYQQGADSYEEMTNLPATLRELLGESHPLYTAEVVNRQISRDGTRKYVVRFHDHTEVETVAMPSFPPPFDSDTRVDHDLHHIEHPLLEDGLTDSSTGKLTVCVSSQAGCPMGCTFCATGKEGFARNLLPGEIVDQILIAQKDMSTRISNVVVMGQGEPFLNYDAVIAALKIINSPDGLNIGSRRITVSTCGIIEGINRFSQEPEQFTLAVSLHSARQRTRDSIMPKVRSIKIRDLKESLLRYVSSTNRRVTLEYVMIKGVNDSREELDALKEFCSGLLCHINLLPMNDVFEGAYSPSPQGTLHYWKKSLSEFGIETTIRNSRGSDIAGACGQLKNSF